MPAVSCSEGASVLAWMKELIRDGGRYEREGKEVDTECGTMHR